MVNEQNGLLKEILHEKEEKEKKEKKINYMVVFPKQSCKRFLPETGQSRRDKLLSWKLTWNWRLHLPGKHIPQDESLLLPVTLAKSE